MVFMEIVYRKPQSGKKRSGKKRGPVTKWGVNPCLLCQIKLTQEEERTRITAHPYCALLRCKEVFEAHGMRIPSQRNADAFLKYVLFQIDISEETEEILEAAFFFLSAARPFFAFNRLRREAEAFG
ncbi:MAG: hypothetical protein WC120_00835 [Parcubacteria group bacterium]